MDQFEQRQMIQKVREQYFKIEVEVLDGGTLPFKKNASDAGFDVYATEDITIYPGQVLRHPLNIRVKLPKNTWAEVASKSGLGAQGLLVYAGVIDEEYRGIWHVVMSNVYLIQGIDPEGFPLMRTDPIVIKKGEKLAQFVMSPYSSEFYVTQVDAVSTDTSRGEGGFGSQGK